MKPFLSITDICSLTSFEFETACRQYTSFAGLEGRTALARVLTRYKMFIDTSDVSLVPHLIMDGFWETHVTQCFCKLINKGDVCIDVGAHLGYFSVLMSALAGGEGRTLAVEPNPSICSLLHLTSGINYPGFDVWEGALSNTTGEMQIHIPKGKTGDSSLLVRAESNAEGMVELPVSVSTLDQLLHNRNFSRVDIMKIDAEGAEPAIFEGMGETLRNNPNLKIVMEYSPHLYEDVRSFNQFLMDRFDVYQIAVAFALEKITSGDMIKLASLRTHTDLLLMPKGAELP